MTECNEIGYRPNFSDAMDVNQAVRLVMAGILIIEHHAARIERMGVRTLRFAERLATLAFMTHRPIVRPSERRCLWMRRRNGKAEICPP